MASKKIKGSRKIEMKRIENEDKRLITFSKRKSGIYKKASEPVTLTGAQVAILVFSPSGMPFSFAHPSLESIANRFLVLDEPAQKDPSHALVEAHGQTRIDKLNQQHNELLLQLDAEKKKGELLKLKMKGLECKVNLWETPIDKLNNVEELLKLEATLKHLRMNLCRKITEKTTTLPPLRPDCIPCCMNPPCVEMTNAFAYLHWI